jgi:hypothetical protein
MQRQNLLLTALIATIAIGVPALTDGNLRPANAELPIAPSITVANKIAEASVLTSGNFEKSEHPTNGVNIAKFKSVVIWCKKFNATFGFAPLG